MARARLKANRGGVYQVGVDEDVHGEQEGDGVSEEHKLRELHSRVALLCCRAEREEWCRVHCDPKTRAVTTAKR
eukprot:916246-Rhodomonas_salina.1